MKEWISAKIITPILIFTNLRPVVALKNGMIYTMPFAIIGSVFLLLANIPIPSVAKWVTENGLDTYFYQVFGASFAIMALFGVMGIAYTYVKDSGYEGFAPGLIALVVFILTTNGSVTDAESGITIGNIINKQWTGGQGMISAIIIGLLVGSTYTWFMKKNIRIKLPDSVPENVASSFTALIPACFIITAALFIYIFFDKVLNTTMIEWIYHVIQIPLQGISDSYGGALMIAFLIPFLWFFGVHGAIIISGIMGSLLQVNSLQNQEILNQGKALTLENGGHIVTQQFVDQFITITGSGITIGIVMYMVLFARSKQFKELGKMSISPGIFNINEPVIFATPIVMNPIMAVPFILVPMISASLTYFALYTGLVPLFSAVQVPWTTPPIISGLLVGGWRAALLQAVVLVISFVLYLPFVRKMDNINLTVENQ